ncbi:MAG: hypothetical protein BGO78_00150 [Chloroflexi bacterium 44-23]|nr:MAG: hypothetical protein BGO78_00150 [Chloroflexi bacterium 44-23]
MDLGSLLLISGIALFVLFLILRPFFEIPADKKLISSTSETIRNDQQKSILLAERDRVLRSLQELDFDFSLGKIPEEDYPEQRNLLLRRGADVIKKMNTLSGTQTEVDAIAQVETVIEYSRADGLEKKKVTDEDAEVLALIAARRREKAEKPSSFCPQCGKPVTASDKFCAKCGKTLS